MHPVLSLKAGGGRENLSHIMCCLPVQFGVSSCSPWKQLECQTRKFICLRICILLFSKNVAKQLTTQKIQNATNKQTKAEPVTLRVVLESLARLIESRLQAKGPTAFWITPLPVLLFMVFVRQEGEKLRCSFSYSIPAFLLKTGIQGLPAPS